MMELLPMIKADNKRMKTEVELLRDFRHSSSQKCGRHRKSDVGLPFDSISLHHGLFILSVQAGAMQNLAGFLCLTLAMKHKRRYK